MPGQDIPQAAIDAAKALRLHRCHGNTDVMDDARIIAAHISRDADEEEVNREPTLAEVMRDQVLTDFERMTWRKGVCHGVTLYAWWSDGVQYVGTSGRTLAEAIKEWSYA